MEIVLIFLIVLNFYFIGIVLKDILERKRANKELEEIKEDNKNQSKEIYDSVIEKIFYLDAIGETSLIMTFSIHSDGNVIDDLIRRLSENGFKVFIENEPTMSTDLYYIGVEWGEILE